MSLIAALPAFTQKVEKILNAKANTTVICSKGIADAVHSWATQGAPMVAHDPALQGRGGVDKIAPGTGLPAAKAKLKAALEAAMNSKSQDVKTISKAFTAAHLEFFSQAIIMTQVIATPVAPAGTPYLGTGSGGIGTVSGQGLTKTLATYASALNEASSFSKKTPSQYASKLADASFNFLSSALVTTQDEGKTGGGGTSISGTIS